MGGGLLNAKNHTHATVSRFDGSLIMDEAGGDCSADDDDVLEHTEY